MLWWGVALFSLFTFIATTCSHIGLFFSCFLILFLVLVGAFWYTRKPRWLVLLCVPFLPLFSLLFFELRHPSEEKILDTGTSPFLGTGVITNTLRNQRYTFEHQKKSFVLRTQDLLAVGDEVYVVGRLDSSTQSSLFTSWTTPIRCSSALFGVFDYPAWLRMKGLSGTIFAKQASKQGSSPLGGVSKVREGFKKRTYALYEDSALSSLLLGLLVGDVSSLTSEQYQLFIDAGLVHIVAVSGANMVMLIVFLHALLFFLPYYMRVGVISVLLIWYAVLCGLDSSVLRALIMGLLTLLALLSGRVVHIWRLLLYAYVGMLIRNPYVLVYDLGFSLSFAALLGILFTQEIFSPHMEQRWPRLRSLVMTYMLPTGGATLAVLPFLLFFIGTTNISTLRANILVLPLIPLVMVGGIFSLLFPSWTWLSFLVTKSLVYITTIATYAASWGVYMSIESIVGKYVVAGGLIVLYVLCITRVRIYRQREKTKHSLDSSVLSLPSLDDI